MSTDEDATRAQFHPRGTSNSNIRGNVYDRRKRRQWMLDAFGNGKTCPCHWCKRRLRKPQADRYPRCGHMGGRYTRDNIVPSCADCNVRRCGPGGSKCQVWRDAHGTYGR